MQTRKYSDLECARPLVLVGMMGAGKTTIGRRLAQRLDLPFFDADHEIEVASGMSIADLFKTHGEASFRKGEASVIKRLLEGPPHVLATGGGAVTTPSTQRLIAEKALSIWLRADLETIAQRALQRDTRPLLKNDDPLETLARLTKEREPYYAAANIHVESQSGPHANTVDMIIEALEARPDLLQAASPQQAPDLPQEMENKS